MPISPFKLERFFARYEFRVKHLLSPSDCETLSVREILELADPESLAMWNELRLGYTESPGHPVLREEVARQYDGITPDHVMIAAPEEAIFIAMNALLSPGDHVIVLFPAYQSLYEIPRHLGCDVALWALERTGNGWALDLEKLDRIFTDRTRMLVINFPHNPTGHLPSQQELERMVALAESRGAYILSDEMYRFLEYDPAQRLEPVCDQYETGLSLSGLSKAFGLPGLRIGWLAAREKGLVERWLVFKDYTTICSSAPSEILGIMALRAREKIVTRNLGIIHHNLSNARPFFREHEARFAWLEPRAGSVAFPRWLGHGPVERFCQELLDQQGVLMVPGSLFDFPGEHFRLGLGRTGFSQALEGVGKHLTRLVRRD
jgi:aspartate/methionine/tyrosine aminotransferase